jgi:hypothetical protein
MDEMMTGAPPGDADADASADIRVLQLEARIEWLEAKLEEARQALRPPAAPALAMEDRWSLAGYPFLPPGQLVSFGGDLDPRDFLASGWWAAEGWGVWGRNDRHAIRLHVPDHSGGYVDLHLTVRSFVMPDVPPPVLDITSNGHFLDRFELSGAQQTLKLRLPPSSIDSGNVLLHLRLSHATSPSSVGIDGDTRRLGVGFVSMAIP